jgi:hypothetical protein
MICTSSHVDVRRHEPFGDNDPASSCIEAGLTGQEHFTKKLNLVTSSIKS